MGILLRKKQTVHVERLRRREVKTELAVAKREAQNSAGIQMIFYHNHAPHRKYTVSISL